MKTVTRTVFLLFAASFIFVTNSYCQDEQAESDTLQRLAPNIYVDCNDCSYYLTDYEDHFRRELPFVNFVRDRKLADIHALITSQGTGSGGREYTIEFIGLKDYADMIDTLRCTSRESDTEDIIRSELVRVLKMGLVRYVARTPLAEHVAIEYTLPSEPMAAVDKWNYWVFKIEAGGWFNGEKSVRKTNLWSEIEASRVTEESKISLGVWGNYNEWKSEYSGIRTLSIKRSKGGNANIVWSLGDHWSTGFSSSIWSSTYSNIKINVRGTLGIEYNLFPYDESTRRQLRFEYWLGPSYVDYEEKTIYDRTSEWLASERLTISLEAIQPWGSVYASFTGSHYFHDFDRNRLRLYSRLSFRLFEGFSFNVNGSVSRVHDQLSLRKGEATEEEVLLQRRELATSYEYWGSVGVSYTFGSIYNNIVNPRFGN